MQTQSEEKKPPEFTAEDYIRADLVLRAVLDEMDISLIRAHARDDNKTSTAAFVDWLMWYLGQKQNHGLTIMTAGKDGGWGPTFEMHPHKTIAGGQLWILGSDLIKR